jgi:integrase
VGSRRTNGEGTIYKDHTTGRWRGALTIVFADGARRRVWFRGTTRSDVARQMRAHRTEIAAAPEPLTLGVYLDRWLDAVRPTVKPNTALSYAYHAGRIRQTLGAVPLVDVTPEHVEQLVAALLARGLAPATVHRSHGILHAALEQARRRKLIAANPVEETKPPRVPRRAYRTLAPDEIARLLAAAVDDPLLPLWLLLIAGGLRIGEALGLRRRDIDAAAGSVTVAVQLRRDGRAHAWDLSETKGGRAGVVPLPPEVIALLLVQPCRGAEGLVFTGDDGGPLWHPTVRRAFGRALARAGLPADVRLHDLRHSLGTNLMRAGIHGRIVQALLRHANISITLDLYSHVDPALTRSVVAVTSQLVGRPIAASLQPPGADDRPNGI